MLWAQKWDYKGREYRPYKIPDDWFCVLDHPDLNAVINCASCGRPLPFGDGYTSRSIHNAAGFGYAVCEECMIREIAAERVAYEENE